MSARGPVLRRPKSSPTVWRRTTEIITPRLFVDEIFAKSIKADSIEGLSIWTNQIASLSAKYAGLNAGDSHNGTGGVPASVGNSLLNLDQFSVGSLSVALDASVLGRLSVTGALQVIDAAEFQGETTFARLASFLSDTVFQGKVSFGRSPTFSADTAGFATIEKGRKKVHVVFNQLYDQQPIVTVAMTRDVSPLLNNQADDTLRADVAAVERDFADQVFDSSLQYIVTEKDKTGFTILLSKDAPIDLQFSWIALAVDDAKSFTSGKAEASAPVVTPPIVPVILIPCCLRM